MPERTIIIGGGLIGVASAFELASRGVPVTLLEAQGAVAQGASFANGGMVTASMSDPWNNPGVGRHLLQSLFDPYAAMKLRLHALPGLVGWGFKFLRNSSPARHRYATEQCFHLAYRSALRLDEMIRDLSLNVDYALGGTMKVFSDQAALDGARRMADDLAPFGLRYEQVDRAGLVAKEPELASAADNFIGGIFFPDDGTGDAHAFVEQLAAAAKAKGVDIRLGTKARRIAIDAGKASGVETEEGVIPASRVVLSAGYATPALASPLGVRLAIKPAKGYSVTADMRGWTARPRVTVLDDAMHAGVSVIGDRARLVGTAEFAGADARIEQARIDNLVNLFGRLYPHLADTLAGGEMTPWAGLRPMSADGRPFIGTAGPEGLWINAGQGHLGWTMAAGSAELLADLVLGAAPRLDPAPFSPAR